MNDPIATTDQAPAKKPRAPRKPKPEPAHIPAPIAKLDLPSIHVKHSADLANRLRLIEADIRNSIGLVDAEIEGQQHAHDNARDELIARHELTLSDMDAAHNGKKTDLLVQRGDLTRALAIATAGIYKAEETDTRRA